MPFPWDVNTIDEFLMDIMLKLITGFLAGFFKFSLKQSKTLYTSKLVTSLKVMRCHSNWSFSSKLKLVLVETLPWLNNVQVSCKSK